MIRWIAAIAAAAVIAAPGLAQQGKTPTPIEIPADLLGEGEVPFEPLLMLDEDGRLVLVSDFGETELDVVQQLQRGQWRAKLSRKIEMLIRVDTSTPDGRKALLKWVPDLLSEPTSADAKGSRARRSSRQRWSKHHQRRMRAKRCHTVLQRLGLSGEELKAVRPLLEQVQEARRALAFGDWRARRSLRSPQADPEAKALLAQFRAGRRAREARLSAARKRLQEVVTIKQEALLVAQGILQ